MAILSIPQIYSTWIGAGGNTGAQAIYATATALAESGGDQYAVSPSDDHGLWQINRMHAAEFPTLWPHRYDPHSNARMAIALSGNGINWGPWCTCYLDPRQCGKLRLSAPQSGSPAGDNVSHVAAVIGGHNPGTQGTAGGSMSDHIKPGERGWSHIQRIMGSGGKSWHDQLISAEQYLKGISR